MYRHSLRFAREILIFLKNYWEKSLPPAGLGHSTSLFSSHFPEGCCKKPDALPLAVDFPTRLIFFCRAFFAGRPGLPFED